MIFEDEGGKGDRWKGTSLEDQAVGLGRVRMLERESVQITVCWAKGTRKHMCAPADLTVKVRESKCQLLRKGRRVRKTEKRRKKNVTKSRVEGAENVSQKQGLMPRLGGHGKAAGRARAGNFEVGLPRVWGGGDWLAAVGRSAPPKTTLCSVMLLWQNKVPGGWYICKG